MKRYSLIALVCFGAAAFAADAPEIRYDSVPNFLKLPADLYIGEASGVAINSKKHIFVFSRGNTTGPAYAATASQILEFGPDGKYIREIGRNLYAWSFAHTVRVDSQDNLWAVDKGSDMIIKFDPEGRVQMVFGRKKEASDEGAEAWKRVNPPRPAVDGQFRQPTDVTWDPAGNTYISDGYVNSRVAKFDKNGDWVKQWGTPGKNQGEFNTPHSIAADAKGNIYVADRGNRRIQVFDPDGNFLREFTIDVPVPSVVHMWMGNPPNPAAPAAGNATMLGGAPWAICITPGPGTQYLYSADAYPGRVYKLSLDGKLLGYFGSMGRQPKQFGWIHEMACPSENEIYVAEILNWRVQKLLLHPGPPVSASAK
ncbi:MAG TPA: peptidyl-alpha-hydroxyglycine alpha-amidating lyase family protein [Bryobacteraceae bacterium]|jgi:DNA-binding beta-propeller fold protein YncE|nr:peptidyl-alpha-hydroxyglycine alpha-amidating lyase family protein [Bryobacteraceae bacterium]